MIPTRDSVWRILIVFGLIGALPRSAWAQSKSDAGARMIKLNEEGFSAFSEEDFAKAAQRFEAAHDEVPDPILRKNAAIAWFKAERCVEASEAAVFFLLAEGTQRQDRDEARSVWAHCQLDEAAEALDDGDIKRAESLIARVHILETDKRVNDRVSAARMRLVEARVNAAEGELDRVTVGWGLVGVGAAVLVGTAAYQLVGDSQEGGAAEWVIPTLYGAGALSTLGGLGLVYSGSKQSSQRKEPAALRAPAPAFEMGWSLRF